MVGAPTTRPVPPRPLHIDRGRVRLRPLGTQREADVTHQPGSQWALIAWSEDARVDIDHGQHPGAIFDELIIDRWLHLEQMDDAEWWMCIRTDKGDLHINVHVGETGTADAVTTEWDPA